MDGVRTEILGEETSPRIEVIECPFFEAEFGAPIFAYASFRHLMLDLDGVTLGYSKRIAQYCSREFRAGDCLVVQSDNGHYHLVFNNTIDWDEIVWIMWTLAIKGIVMWKFYVWNKIRANITLRLSTKWYKNLETGERGVKSRPYPVAYLNHPSDRCDSNITEYMEQAGFVYVK